MSRETVRIRVPALARVEGEGALELDIEAGRIRDLKLRIYEPPRLFEKLLEGREFHEVPDLVARICGICPVAYQMSGARALESLLAVAVPPEAAAMRRVMYCGEWIQSHALHIHLLAAPDFFGCDSVVALAGREPEAVRRGLALQALGNRLITLFGGRSVHPVGVKVGGFHRLPGAAEVTAVLGELDTGLAQAEALVHWCAAIDLPDRSQDFLSVATDEPEVYPIMGERIRAGDGLDIGIGEFEAYFEERQVPHSTALHCRLQGRPYLVGPLARLNLFHERLPEPVRGLMRAAGVAFPSNNMFHSMLARALEVFYAVWEARRLLRDYREGAPAAVEAAAGAGTGFGCTEAPRGLLWHRYELHPDGTVARARIVPPTSQNQARMEEDLHRALEAFGLERPPAEIRRHAETVIRNYDPCISCATHFLRLTLRGDRDHAPPPRVAGGPVAVMGIGSPAPGDDAGWRVAEALAGREDVRVLCLDRPGLGLVDHIEAFPRAVLVDAAPGLRRPRWLAPGELEGGGGPLSSHAGGVAEALALARALGLAVEGIRVLAVPADGDSGVDLAVAELTRWLDRRAPA